MKNLFILFCLGLLAAGCSVSRYHPARKFAPDVLKEDYRIFRGTLEEWHPSLYWYTPKDSMDAVFRIGEAKLSDSLTEPKFRAVLSWVVARINCGHTAVRPSVGAARYRDTASRPLFPLALKIWGDTAVVVSNVNRRDSLPARGHLLTALGGRPIRQLIDTFSAHLSRDGYNLTHRYQSLSNRGTFAGLYSVLYGLPPRMTVRYKDSAGVERSGTIGLYRSRPDSLPRQPLPGDRPSRRQRKRQMLASVRQLRTDTALQAAFMELNSFAKGYGVRRFIRSTFRKLDRQNIRHLVIDLRGNGGGNVNTSNLLTRYIADRRFKIADTLYAITNKGPYGKYQKGYWLNRLFFRFMTRRRPDGRYHFTYYEGRYFYPKRRHHFNGQVYILTGGNTFSASTLFAGSVMDQENVTVVGEETGGGAYGNTAWLMPDITLPHTGVRVRVPLFRLVIDGRRPRNGRGLLPEVPAYPTWEAIRKGVDFKMEAVKAIIRGGEGAD
ncbi:MAG TPA: S41 family peptidase [Chitinophagaceae bacterium]|nr:S41 family peptidase [Chitinophagaceae bacterium]